MLTSLKFLKNCKSIPEVYKAASSLEEAELFDTVYCSVFHPIYLSLRLFHICTRIEITNAY